MKYAHGDMDNEGLNALLLARVGAVVGAGDGTTGTGGKWPCTRGQAPSRMAHPTAPNKPELFWASRHKTNTSCLNIKCLLEKVSKDYPDAMPHLDQQSC
jgi:hypothetical protein